MRFLWNFFCALLSSFSLGVVVSTIVLMILFSVVNIFELNYKGNSYWVFNMVFISFILSFLFGLGYFMMVFNN
jgi:hypothetical protein